MGKELTTTELKPGMSVRAYTPEELIAQQNVIQHVMRKAMREGEHYGKIPGCGDKPTLLKPGAEKLSFTFRLAPRYEIRKTDLPGGHREYEVICTLQHIDSGLDFGQGVGVCSTQESKYRYRNTKSFEVTDQPIPRDSKERKAEYRAQGFGMQKVDGRWVWVKYTEGGERSENEDPADCYNTVLKMAKKRAHVDASLTCLAASDIFTQDIEDQAEEPPADDAREQRKEANLKAIQRFADELELCETIADVDGLKDRFGAWARLRTTEERADVKHEGEELQQRINEVRAGLEAARHFEEVPEAPETLQA